MDALRGEKEAGSKGGKPSSDKISAGRAALAAHACAAEPPPASTSRTVMATVGQHHGVAHELLADLAAQVLVHVLMQAAKKLGETDTRPKRHTPMRIGVLMARQLSKPSVRHRHRANLARNYCLPEVLA